MIENFQPNNYTHELYQQEPQQHSQSSQHHQQPQDTEKLANELSYNKNIIHTALDYFLPTKKPNGSASLPTDRFIPSRKYSKLSTYSIHSWDENSPVFINKQSNPQYPDRNDKIRIRNTMDKIELNHVSIPLLYQNKILGISKNKILHELSSLHAFCPFQNRNVLRYSDNHRKNCLGNSRKTPKDNCNVPSSIEQQLFYEQNLECPHQLKTRRIPKNPFKVLDAPALQDDFYLNLIDWSSHNALAVGLSSCVYLWSASSAKVTKLCDFGTANEVTSVCWSPQNTQLAMGTNTGEVEIWDSVKLAKIRVLHGHSLRVGSLAWNPNCLASGSRDKNILLRDLRSKNSFESKLAAHKQEVCGLKWSFDDQCLASGGNDNKLLVWSAHNSKPLLNFNSHTAAVKALAWSPHQQGLLVSGGGTQDRTIRFWNTRTNKQLECYETGSQVCNLMFSKTVNELVSTHGYSQNQIIVWSYPDMEKIATLSGHTCRVLFLAMSPNGQTIVTGAGDETLRFWNVFPSNTQATQGGQKEYSVTLNKESQDLR